MSFVRSDDANKIPDLLQHAAGSAEQAFQKLFNGYPRPLERLRVILAQIPGFEAL
jgi:hypothetical protein